MDLQFNGQVFIKNHRNNIFIAFKAYVSMRDTLLRDYKFAFMLTLMGNPELKDITVDVTDIWEIQKLVAADNYIFCTSYRGFPGSSIDDPRMNYYSPEDILTYIANTNSNVVPQECEHMCKKFWELNQQIMKQFQAYIDELQLCRHEYVVLDTLLRGVFDKMGDSDKSITVEMMINQLLNSEEHEVIETFIDYLMGIRTMDELVAKLYQADLNILMKDKLNILDLVATIHNIKHDTYADYKEQLEKVR